MNESIQKWLERNRPPRVKITYDVETGGAIEKRELPFVVGVFADLSGDANGELPDYAGRTMQAIDRDSFNDVMAQAKPTIQLGQIARTLPGDPAAGTLAGSLTFTSMSDFDPVAIVQKVDPLAQLYRQRANIRMLQTRVETSATLARVLAPAMSNDSRGDALRAALQALAPPAKREDALPAALEALSGFSIDFARASTEKDKAAATTKFGFTEQVMPTAEAGKSEPDDAATAGLGRAFIGLFTAKASDENQRNARGALAKATKEDGQLLAQFDAGDPDTRLAALLQVGLAQAENASAVTNSDPVTGMEERHLADSRWFSNNLLMAVTSKPAPGSFASVQLVLDILEASGAQTDHERQSFVAPLGDFATEVLQPRFTKGALPRKTVAVVLAVDERVAEIDELLSGQLRAIMHWPGFQAVEATWRALFHLVSRAETGRMLKIHVFNATKQELLDDMQQAVDKDQSYLFKMIYEAGYGTLGGEPYSLLVGGYEIARASDDIEFLARFAEVAASAHAPFITAADPSLFVLDSFADLARPRDLEKIFESVELAGFQAFRQSEDSRYVTLVLPRVLLRLPYGAKSLPVHGLSFEESVDAGNPKEFLWGNAAFLLAERITNAFSIYSWTAAIRGVEGGGLVEDLPLYTYPIYGANSDAQQLFCPTELSITDRREKELSDLGFVALCHCLGKGTAAFFGGQTANKPKSYISDDANANARLSATLPYILAASRFAHYIKVIMRDKIGSFLTRSNVEVFLNSWISQYVLLDENAPQDAKASYPLSQANVVVTEVPGEPGSYKAVVFLRPHFQLEELTASIRLVASLPAAK